MKQITGGITAAKGFQASGTYCGIKKAMAPDSNEGEIGKEKNDIALVVAPKGRPQRKRALWRRGALKVGQMRIS